MNTPGVDPASQFGQEVASGIGQFPPFQAISPVVEYLLQMLSSKPTPGYTTSQQVGPSPYAGPQRNPALKQQMMQRPQPTQETY